MVEKILIVGGVAGGASAAARLRRLNETAEIIVFERGEYISFANCGLPYYIGETITERDQLIVQTPEKMKERFNLDIRTNSEVTAVDSVNKRVTVSSQDRGTYEESYDYVILSPGAKPIKPPIPGINGDNIYTLRNIPDTDRIKEVVDRGGIKHAAVIGGGFIGVEMAENLRERGLEVALIEAAPHILAPYDSEMVRIAEKEMEENGVQLILGDGVQEFNETNDATEVVLQSGRTISTDLIILAIGVAPDTAFLRDSGIELGARGHIIVNEHMQTSLDGVYAVGDAIETKDYTFDHHTAIPLAGPANKQGRIAADHICGLDSSYKGSQGTAIIKIFNLTGASTGHNERSLQNLGIPYHSIIVHPASHAGYYPGASTIALKLLFDPEGKVLGAQAFGQDGVDKRIDVIATVIRLHGTIYDLTELELSYAPPYSSAKDPVNMAGYVAENILTGKLKVFTVNDIKDIDLEHTSLLDVRSKNEYDQGHIPGATHYPVDELRERLHELNQDRPIYIYCEVGLRGYIASRILQQHGFDVSNLTGGYRTYRILSNEN